VFPVRYGLDLCILFRINSVFKGLRQLTFPEYYRQCHSLEDTQPVAGRFAYRNSPASSTLMASGQHACGSLSRSRQTFPRCTQAS
jgi:hypothetical protein